MNTSSTNTRSFKFGDLWPAARQLLEDHYSILTWVDILEENLSLYPERIYQRFLPWAGYAFQPGETIMVHHRDTDYYYTPDCVGFTMQNLYQVFARLDIACDHVRLLSAYPDIAQESEHAARQAGMPAMKTLYAPYQWCPLPEHTAAVDLNAEHIQCAYVCLNGRPRQHRMYTLAMLKEMAIWDHGMVSLWPNRNSANHEIKAAGDAAANSVLPDDLHLCKTVLPTNINETLVLTHQQRRILTRWFPTLTPYRSRLIEGAAGDHGIPLFLQRALWNITLETVGEYPHTFMTEKTVKAILTKRPFVLLGGHRPLAALERLGFRTFGRWIDQGYDTEATFAQRCDRALREIAHFCDRDPKQLQTVLREMQPILEHNFEHYRTAFGGVDLDNLIRSQL